MILFGSEGAFYVSCPVFCTQSPVETDNIINEKSGGYDNVSEYVHIAQPNANTLAKLHELQPSSTIGDRK